jgi:integrase/recombinase XerC/integrase/recombinase XerD
MHDEGTTFPVPLEHGIVPSSAFESVLQAFLSSQDIKDSSKVIYRAGLKQFLAWLKDNGISNPNRNSILDYKAELKNRSLSPNSISVYIVGVRRFFEWTEGMKFYPNIARGVKAGKKSKGFKKDVLTLDQIKELFESIDRNTLRGKRDFAILNLLLRTGLRTIEAIRADVGDIRQQSGEAVLWIQGKGRDGKDEFVLLTQDTLRPIYEYLKERGDTKEKPLFASISDRNKGERLTTKSIRRIVKDRLKAIEIVSDRLSAHSLRHTAVTLSLKAGSTIQEAQALARHSNINTTLVYAQNIDRIKNAAEKRIDEILKQATEESHGSAG